MNIAKRFLKIYPGEGKRAFFVSFLIFLGSLGTSGGVTLADGRFMEEVGGVGLPYCYLMTSLLMISCSCLLIWSVNRFTINTIFNYILGACAVIYVAQAAWLTHPSVAAWYALKVFGDFLLLLIFTGLWLYIDHSYPLQQGKRLFGLFSASFVVGMSAGGIMVSLGVDSLGSVGLLVIFSAALVLALLLALREDVKPVATEEASEPEPIMKIGELCRRMLASKYTLFLLIFNVAIATMQIVAEYTYLDALERIFQSDSGHGLTRFVGGCRGWIYAADIIFGAVIYSRIVKRIGIDNVAFLPAGSFLLLFIGWFSLEGMVIAVIGIAAVEGVIPAIEDTNFNLQQKVIPPRIKTKVRILNEQFIEPFGMLVSSLLLMRFGHHARWIGLGLSVVGLIGAVMVRRHYAKAVYANLRENAANLDDQVSEDELVLDFNEEDALCIELNRLAIEGSPHHFESILPHLNHESIDVQRAAMGALAKLAGPLARRHTRRLITGLVRTDDRQVRSLCLLALKKTATVEHVTALVRIAADLRPSEKRHIEEILVGIGRSAVPRLLTLTGDMTLDGSERLLTGRALGLLAPMKLQRYLPSLVGGEIESGKPSELLIHLVAMAGGLDDCDLLCRSLQSSNPVIHSQAVETLEKNCPPKLFRKILPLLEEV